MKKDSHRYDDMLDMPHHVSLFHPHMPQDKRASQFASFKSLNGYEDEIDETAKEAVIKAENDIEHQDFYD